METLLAYLPAVACVGMMLFVCVPMLFGHRAHPRDAEHATSEEVAALRDEIVRLKAERSVTTGKESLDG